MENDDDNTKRRDCPQAQDPRPGRLAHQYVTRGTTWHTAVCFTEHRVCRNCGFTLDEPRTLTEEQISDAKRATRQTLNENALRALPVEFPGIRFPDVGRERADWRATAREKGKLTGLEHLGSLTVVATNGVVAWFLRDFGPPFCGHVASFTGDVRPFGSEATGTGGGFRRAKPKSKKQEVYDDL